VEGTGPWQGVEEVAEIDMCFISMGDSKVKDVQGFGDRIPRDQVQIIAYSRVAIRVALPVMFNDRLMLSQTRTQASQRLLGIRHVDAGKGTALGMRNAQIRHESEEAFK